ncbi:MAG: hypothetical protein HDS92_03585 [Bacteroidales bacterium]|nr:hypothetical protein [Bacteroidales bacterium]
MRSLLISILLAGAALASSAQSSVNDRLAAAMNSGNWFALDSVYNQAPKDSVMPFLDAYSRALIGNRLNRPDMSIPAFTELLNVHSQYLDVGNLLNSAVMLSMDMSRTGADADAAAMLSAVLDATREHLDSAAVAGVQRFITQYSALSPYSPYTISFDGELGHIPFSVVPVGPAEKESVLIHLNDCSINGSEVPITFDTGAGVNIISDTLATRLGLIPLGSSITVSGIGRRDARFALARELKMGNITVRDVPFAVMSLTLDNEEANRHVGALNIVVGSELMLRLKDLTIDFADSVITVPAKAPERSGAAPNLCFSSSMNLLTPGRIGGIPMLMCVDTGDSSYGDLSRQFLEQNHQDVMAGAVPDSIRMAGIGGVSITQGYKLLHPSCTIAGTTVTLPSIFVTSSDATLTDHEANLGLKSLILFRRLRFNLIDFTLTPLP